MGAAPVLIMLAAVGVDYGWHPDGTTSSQGDNIEYIVQIAPDQLQQLKSIGEITSTIDPAVQGRVSRIVVKIGTGPLPQDAGRTRKPALSVQNSGDGQMKFADAADTADMPRPQITGNVPRVQLAGDSRGLPTTSGSQALLKPDPQGFAMPESAAQAGQSALDQVRSGVNNAGTQLEAQAQSAFDAIPGATKQAASDILNRAVDSVKTGINQNLAPGTNAASAPNFTGTANGASFQFNPDPATAGRDNQWNDLSGRSGAAAGVPSTDTPARNANWTNTTTSSSANNAPATTDPRTTFGMTTNAGPATTAAITPTTNSGLSGAAVSQPKTPNDPGWSGYGTSSTFGTAPAGVSLPTNNTNNVANNSAPGYGTPSYPANGGFANTNNQAPNTGVTAGADYYNQNSAAQSPYAHTASSWNTPSTQPNNAPNTSTAWPPTTYPNSGTNLPNTNPATANTTAMEQLIVEQAEKLKQMQSKVDSLQQRDRAQTNLVNLTDDQIRSASDWANSPQARAERERLSATTTTQPPATYQPTKSRNVDAPRFFNFILLLSLVGNAYLIFETNNLRRKFKSMISSVRASKVGAQPATS